MATIINAIRTVCGAIWFDMMQNDYLPDTHIDLQDIYIFTWIALIFVELFRVLIFLEIEDAVDRD